jgi:uncharacterized ferritin-like protein (DUF455 family)
MTSGLFAEAGYCLRLRDPASKCESVSRLAAAVECGTISLDFGTQVPPVDQPGRPELPCLVDPSGVPRRRLGTVAGRAALVHAIAHIEFNAINLALDAVCRFRDMPEAYYRDWVCVAADEAKHFCLLQRRLAELGASYGDFPAHNGLWEMAERTADSCLVRMALVPRVLEARGLDVTPGMIERLRRIGDFTTIATLEVILDEEIGHVAIGTRWFNFCCKREGREPLATFLELLKTRYSGTVRGPFNHDARLAAGFSPAEMDALAATLQPLRAID